jgi:hypothetical protein
MTVVETLQANNLSSGEMQRVATATTWIRLVSNLTLALTNRKSELQLQAYIRDETKSMILAK